MKEDRFFLDDCGCVPMKLDTEIRTSYNCYVKQKSYSFFSNIAAAAAAKSLQSYLTLCDPADGSPPGSAIPGILQARTLEYVHI